MEKIYNVCIVGGGVSGVVIALELAELGINHVLFEQENSVVNGPPFCHLHAGGSLYPDISDEQCKVLLKQSIGMARMFPQSIDERPTLISIPKSEKYEIEKVEHRLKMLAEYYKALINEDPSNKIIGAPEDYFKIYNKEKLVDLAQKPNVKNPKNANEWVSNAIKLIDLDQLKMPIILVQEYGWNLFRLGAQSQLALNRSVNCNLKLNTKVNQIKKVNDKELGYNWEITTNTKTYKTKYLVNACGYKTAAFDEPLALTSEHLIEFKAAYVSKWQPIQGLIPELIFYGERGTPHGMAQLTPYCEDYYQIHGMSKEVTLFENGLMQAKENEPQPEFNEAIKKKLNKDWTKEEINLRTENAINFVSKFVPSFKSAKVGSQPLYGAQQITGDDPDLRVGEVSFPSKFYARSEIIKASSALVVANKIIAKIQEEDIITSVEKENKNNNLLAKIKKTEIDKLANALAIQRGYPKALAQLMIEKL